MSLFCFSRWQDGDRIIFFACVFPSSKGGSCLLAQQRSKALRSLQCLWLCSSSPAARWSGSQKLKGGRRKYLFASASSFFLLPFSPRQRISRATTWGENSESHSFLAWQWTFQMHSDKLYPSVLGFALLFLMLGERSAGSMCCVLIINHGVALTCPLAWRVCA